MNETSLKPLVIRVVCSGVAMLVAVAILFFSTTSLGWFSANRNVDGSRLEIKVDKVSTMRAMECYSLRYDGISGAACVKVSDDVLIPMSEYDMIFTDRNVNTPLIFRMVVSDAPCYEGAYIEITIPCEQKYVMTSGSEESNQFEGSSFADMEVLDYLSNVLIAEIGCGIYTTPDATEKVPDTFTPFQTTEETKPSENGENIALFEGVRNAVKRSDRGGYTTEQFCTVSESESGGVTTVTLNKTQEIVLTLPYDEYKDFLYIPGDEEMTPGAGTLSAEGTCFVLNIVLDYEDTLVEIFSDSFGGEMEGIVKFENDIGTITLTEGGTH